ncbi:hypothetical protein GGI21_006102, partial [Coemansia aciculifera]
MAISIKTVFPDAVGALITRFALEPNKSSKQADCKRLKCENLYAEANSCGKTETGTSCELVFATLQGAVVGAGLALLAVLALEGKLMRGRLAPKYLLVVSVALVAVLAALAIGGTG